MKKQFFLTAVTLAGAVLYSWLFWRAPMGLNTLLFSAFAVGMVVGIHPETLRSRAAYAAAGVLLSAIMIVWHNSVLGKLLHIGSFFLLIGYVQVRELRFLVFAFLLGISGILTAPVSVVREWSRVSAKQEQVRSVLRWVGLLLLPLLIGSAFFMIYYVGNDEFAAVFKPIGRWLEWLARINWPVARTITLIVGFLLMGALLWPSLFGELLLPLDRRFRSTLTRRRLPPERRWVSFGPLALRRHYWTGVLTLSLLNGLLLLLNLTDLRYVWMDLGEKSAQQLSQYVHAGTSALIFSILLAMLVLLFFFYGNLNFYSENRPLRRLGYLWLGQNALLALSVGLRNMHYLLQYGLTYKRIGVLAFLLLVLYGLWTIYLKIRDRRTLFFLVQQNGWAAYCLLLLLATVNWDLAITRYNIYRPAREGIDVAYLADAYELSDQNLFLLERYRDRLLPHTNADAWNEWLKKKRRTLRHRLEQRDWRSWNWPDQRNKQFLQGPENL